jgi:hypothetical protein
MSFHLNFIDFNIDLTPYYRWVDMHCRLNLGNQNNIDLIRIDRILVFRILSFLVKLV